MCFCFFITNDKIDALRGRQTGNKHLEIKTTFPLLRGSHIDAPAPIQ